MRKFWLLPLGALLALFPSAQAQQANFTIINGVTCLLGSACTVSGGGGTFNALTGDATSTSTGGATTVLGVNNTLFSSLATGILKNTTATGVPSIAVAAVFPTLNLSTTGNATTASAFNTNGTSLQVWSMNLGATAQGWATISSGGDTIVSTNSTLTVAGTPLATTLDLNLGKANTWTGQQTFVAPVLGTPASGVITNLTGTCTSCGVGGNAATATVLSQVTVPTVSLWTTAVNQQGTYSQTNIPQGVLIADSNTGTFQQIEGALAAYPGTAFTLDVLVGLPYVASSNIQVGILTASSATGNMELIGPRMSSFATNAITAWAYYIQDFTAPATYSAGPLNGIISLGATYIWLQYKDDGTYIYYNASGDGFTWGNAYKVLKTSGFLYTNGYNFIGVGMYPSTGTGLGSGFSVLSWKITTP